MKGLVYVLLPGLMFLSLCIGGPATETTTQVSSTSMAATTRQQTTTQPSTTHLTTGIASTTTAATSTTIREPVVREFNIVAKRFSYSPNTIRVGEGDVVHITLTSVDVQHGFRIDEYDITAEINPGNETGLEFTADKKGTFTFYCNIFCGTGHKNMKGTLIVD